MSPKFITASQLAREVNCSTGRITAAIESGILQPDGRAGANPNAAFIFLASRLDEIKATLATANRAKAFAVAPRPSHQCKSASEVLEKYDALRAAKGDAR